VVTPHASPPVSKIPVYTITSMAVASSGARKVLQMEVAVSPSQPIPYGLFATGTTCGSMTFSGNGATDSYNSQLGNYGRSNKGQNGDVGTFGNLTISGNGTIGGIVGVSNDTFPSASKGIR